MRVAIASLSSMVVPCEAIQTMKPVRTRRTSPMSRCFLIFIVRPSPLRAS